MTPKIRTIVISSGIVVALILAGCLWYAAGQRAAYLESKGASAVLTADFNTFKAFAETSILSLTAEASKARTERDKAIAKADAAAQSIPPLQAEIDHLKTLTAALSPDALSGQINQRVGPGSITPRADGLYICTRAGAESTLNRFLDGEGYARKYETEQRVSASLRSALSAAASETAAISDKYTLKDGEFSRAVKAWQSDKDALRHLERSMFGLAVKHVAIGAGVGAVAVLIFNAIKGK